MKTWTTTTPENCEGHNISYGDEKRCAEELLAELPTGWSVHFDWCQIMFQDVQYWIDVEEKKVSIRYCQSLVRWFPEMLIEIVNKVSSYEKAPHKDGAPSLIQ